MPKKLKDVVSEKISANELGDSVKSEFLAALHQVDELNTADSVEEMITNNLIKAASQTGASALVFQEVIARIGIGDSSLSIGFNNSRKLAAISTILRYYADETAKALNIVFTDSDEDFQDKWIREMVENIQKKQEIELINRKKRS